MRKVIIAGAVAALGLVACQNRNSEVQDKREDVAKERAEFNKEATDIRHDANQESAEAQRDANEKIADKREDLNKDERELSQKEAEAARDQGVGGSGLQSGTLTGTMKSSMGSGLTVVDNKGAELKLDTDDNTIVTWQGKKVKLDDFKEGTEVRTSWTLKDDDKVARTVEILKPVKK